MEVSPVLHASIVISLMFIIICIEPNNAQTVRVVIRCMLETCEEHLNTVKWGLRYIKGTSEATLCNWGSKFIVIDYVDLNFAGCQNYIL